MEYLYISSQCIHKPLCKTFFVFYLHNWEPEWVTKTNETGLIKPYSWFDKKGLPQWTVGVERHKINKNCSIDLINIYWGQQQNYNNVIQSSQSKTVNLNIYIMLVLIHLGTAVNFLCLCSFKYNVLSQWNNSDYKNKHYHGRQTDCSLAVITSPLQDTWAFTTSSDTSRSCSLPGTTWSLLTFKSPQMAVVLSHDLDLLIIWILSLSVL